MLRPSFSLPVSFKPRQGEEEEVAPLLVSSEPLTFDVISLIVEVDAGPEPDATFASVSLTRSLSQ